MRKTLTKKNLNERSTGRTLLAFSLAASLAAFGCTTNKTPGNGEPIRSAPGVGPAAPTSGMNSGSSSGSTGTSYQPMTSSSTYIEALPTVKTRSKKLPLSPNEAAMIMADNVLGRARVLGPSNPGSSHVYMNNPVAQQAALPGQTGYGIVTVNSSINSAGQVPGVVNEGGGVVTGTGTTTTGTAAALTTTGATTPVTAGTAAANTTITPTAATLPVTAGSFAAGPGTSGVVSGTSVNNSGTLTPTVSSSQVPSTTFGSSGILSGGTVSNGAVVATGRTIRNTGAVTANVTTNGTTASATVANPVRIFQDASGRVTVSNASSKSPK